MRKPYHLSDATRASERRKAALYLAAHAAQNLLGDSSDGEGSDSDGEEEVQQLCVVVALLRSARMPFLKQMPRLVIGPRHYSFARIVDQWGHGTQNCEDTFRFDLPGAVSYRRRSTLPDSFALTQGGRCATCG